MRVRGYQAMAWLRSAVGVGLIAAPGAPMRLATGEEPSGADLLLMRTIGIRDLVLGLGAVAAARAGDPRDIRRWTAAALASDSLDAAASLASTRSVGKRDSWAAAALALAFACGDMYALRRTPGPYGSRDFAGGPRIVPIGWVESPLRDRSQAPRQGYLGAPPAWLVFEPEVIEGIRDLRPGTEVIVLTWLDRSHRDVLATRPGDDPGSPPLGVFSTRSPDRPNPVGLHRVQVVAVDGARVLVHGLEALDGTPVVDVKPVLDKTDER